MTDERAALLRTIVDNPMDDLPRGVMADYLGEQPDASDWTRAEFIRIQLARAEIEQRSSAWKWCKCSDNMNKSGPVNSSQATPRCRGQRCRLLRMERSLLDRHWYSWSPGHRRHPAADARDR